MGDVDLRGIIDSFEHSLILKFSPADCERYNEVNNLKTSACLPMFRRDPDTGLEILLVHPGGPFLRNKDEGAWTIPKGEAAPGENLVDRARIEFEEELGFVPPAVTCLDLGHIQQKGGKIVYCWAFEGHLPQDFALKSNTFEIEWPPRSGNSSNSRKSIARNCSRWPRPSRKST